MTHKPGPLHLAALVAGHAVAMPIIGAMQVLKRIAFPLVLAGLAFAGWRWL